MIERINSDPSDSAVQRETERVMLNRLGEQHGDWQRVNWRALAAELGLASMWQKTEPDAVWKKDSEVIIAECYSHIGRMKPGHRRKLAMDALKLLALKSALEGTFVRCILVVPTELKDELNGDGWFPAALRLTAEVTPVNLLESERKKLITASALQSQGQARTKRDEKDRFE